ncbi:hypothetical protein N9571_00750, partial [Yoonia sp.]|nr:hypothetical protein [Yoonia sp.]
RDCLEVARQISRNMQLAPSIDNYLDTHKDNKALVNVGKLAIANAIIKAEKEVASLSIPAIFIIALHSISALKRGPQFSLR